MIMFNRTTFFVGISLLAALGLKACDERRFITLPDGTTSIKVGSIFSTDAEHWTVTVKNKYGRSSDRMFAIGDNPRLNIYLTSSGQLVVIGKGGEELFFRVPSKAGPIVLNGQQAKLRDRHSETWHYVGVVENRALTHNAECIPLMGEGRSPYRKQFQSEHSC